MSQINKLIGTFVVALIVSAAFSSHAQQTAGGTASITNGFVIAITVTNGGSGYSFAPAVAITGGGGTGAIANSTISNGIVIAINVTDAGSGYTSIPQVIVDPPDVTLFSSSLVLNLPLDGTIVDQGPFHFGVTNNGGTFTTNRFWQPNSAVSLNGVNQNVYVPNNASLFPTEMTLCIWLNPQQTNLTASIIESGDNASDGWHGYNLLHSGPDAYYLDYTGSGFNASVLIPSTNFVLGKWRQLVVTRTTNSCSVFVDGVKVGFQNNLTPYAKPQFTPHQLRSKSISRLWLFLPDDF